MLTFAASMYVSGDCIVISGWGGGTGIHVKFCDLLDPIS